MVATHADKARAGKLEFGKQGIIAGLSGEHRVTRAQILANDQVKGMVGTKGQQNVLRSDRDRALV